MKKTIAACLVAAICAGSLMADEKTIRLDALADGIVLGTGAAGAVACQLALGHRSGDLSGLDAAELGGLDRATVRAHDEGLAKLSLGLAGASALAPAAFALVGERDEVLPAALVFAEALSWTYASKELLKWAFPKARPYAYAGAALEGELADEAWESFPSGHSALAFCGATALATLCLELAPERPATPWLVAGGYLLAAGTGLSRVLAGDHFLSDVAAGAALGSALGWGAVRAHIARPEGAGPSARGLGIDAGPFGLVVSLRY